MVTEEWEAELSWSGTESCILIKHRHGECRESRQQDWAAVEEKGFSHPSLVGLSAKLSGYLLMAQ